MSKVVRGVCAGVRDVDFPDTSELAGYRECWSRIHVDLAGSLEGTCF